MSTVQDKIKATVARAKREGLEPKSFYLNAEDFVALGKPAAIGGLPVKRVKGQSRIYCRHGIARFLRLDRPPYERPPP